MKWNQGVSWFLLHLTLGGGLESSTRAPTLKTPFWCPEELLACRPGGQGDSSLLLHALPKEGTANGWKWPFTQRCLQNERKFRCWTVSCTGGLASHCGMIKLWKISWSGVGHSQEKKELKVRIPQLLRRPNSDPKQYPRLLRRAETSPSCAHRSSIKISHTGKEPKGKGLSLQNRGRSSLCPECSLWDFDSYKQKSETALRTKCLGLRIISCLFSWRQFILSLFSVTVKWRKKENIDPRSHLALRGDEVHFCVLRYSDGSALQKKA